LLGLDLVHVRRDHDANRHGRGGKQRGRGCKAHG
jgi:hypothetical protein